MQGRLAIPVAADTPIFPVDELGPPLRADYRYGVDMGLVRTSFESGATRQRRRFLTQPLSMALAWDLTTAQVARFAAFAAQWGYGWFTMSLPTIQTPGTLVDPPVYLTPISLRFTTNYVVTATGFDRFKVEVGAEVATAKTLETFLQLYWTDDDQVFYFASDAARVFLGRT